ncbi:MAG TPA: NAD-dependent epimerase/dehydratase family protein [Longimicrobiales bacterium]
MDWSAPSILVTGGASFIGSHLVDALVARGARRIRVVDDLSSGRLENIQDHVDQGRVDFTRADLLDPGVPGASVRGIDLVFHLAALHGGRGYVDYHQAACARNLALDGLVLKASHAAGVEKLVFASSGCVYPNYRQQDSAEELYLTEDLAGPPYDADNLYGWAKLMMEMALRAYHEELGFKSASCRLFTVYGERGVENHAIMAMIARAFIGQDPFEVWGDGTQVRNWTYVGDIVEGLVLSAERIEDATAVNLGTEERIRVLDAAREILALTGRAAEFELRPDMPTGPVNRVASNRLAAELLGWTPRTPFREGLHRTVEWYFSTKDRDEVRAGLEGMLVGR